MWWQEHASTCPILYGVDKIDISRPLLIVEGHIDRLSCIEAGFTNVVSIPHGAADTNWINFNWEWLKNFDVIILWSDNDDAGRKFIKETTVRIGEERCKVVDPSERVEKAVSDFWKQYNQDINKTDANNVLLACGKQEILDLIANANDVPIPDVIKLMECPDFDINKALVLDTGIADLDNYIFGYVEGSLNIWTGRTGGGKSSFILQSCLDESLNSGYSTFMFSGELTPPQLKSWVVSQLAGRRHMIEWDNGANKPDRQGTQGRRLDSRDGEGGRRGWRWAAADGAGWRKGSEQAAGCDRDGQAVCHEGGEVILCSLSFVLWGEAA
jgi:twinkle protein